MLLTSLDKIRFKQHGGDVAFRAQIQIKIIFSVFQEGFRGK